MVISAALPLEAARPVSFSRL